MKNKIHYNKYFGNHSFLNNNRSITITGYFIVIISLLLSSGCKNKKEQAQQKEKLFIVTTTGMIQDAVQNITGNKAKVVALMGSGVDPHLYKATHGDLEKLTQADVIFYNGLHLEGKMSEVLEKLGNSKAVVAVSKDIPLSRLRKVGDNIHDPHIWFDVSLWSEGIKSISLFMQQFDTANAHLYKLNTATYIQKLDSLHQSIKTNLLEIPEQQRVLITAHDAFGYFGDAYGIEVRGLQGISTVSEFGLKDVTDLVNFIIEHKIKAIFVETSVSQKSINAVVEGCKAKGWKVNIGGSLYSDAMGAEGTPEGTYEGMVKANVKTIVQTLK